MVSTSGAQLLPMDAVRVLRTELLPRTTVLTPNLPEAKLLLSEADVDDLEIRGVADLERVAREVHALGPLWVLVKGGHVPFKSDLTIATSPEERRVVVDVLYGDGLAVHIQSPYQDSPSTHGTGCTLACETNTALNTVFVCDSNCRSCHRVESLQRDGCSRRRPVGLQICRGRHQDGPRLWAWPRAP